MVKEIHGAAEFQREIKTQGLVVVDFFTTWCGPCKAIAPVIDQLSRKYPEVIFIKVDIEQNRDISDPLRISSIPTFHFYVKGNLVDEMKGANASMLEQKVIQYKVEINPFAGSGFKLASANPENTLMSEREARLKAFGNIEGPHKKPEPKAAPTVTAPPPQPSATNADDEEEEKALAEALKLSVADSSSNAMDVEEPSDEELVPVPVNEDLLSQLIDMGFADARSRKSIIHGTTLEGALAWLDQHQDDPDIDQPYLVRKSEAEAASKPMTEEEKAAKMQEIKDKVKKRREDRAKQEKAEEIRRERERRERGAKIDSTLEEREKLQRKREQERVKREKMEVEKERQRLRAELARDKEIRRANKGVLPSVLGVDGYNPSIIQYDQPGADAPPPASATASAKPAAPAVAALNPPKSEDKPAPAKKPVSKSTPSPTPSDSELSPAQRVDQAIQTIMRYRTGGDGGQALKLLVTFIKNIAENPGEQKYRSINTESTTFKSKLAPIVGVMALLKTVGFEKSDEDGKLKYEEKTPLPALFTDTLHKLVQAEQLYRIQNS